MANDDLPWEESPDGDLPIVIAGGGISGLYCAYQLGKLGHRVMVLERSHQCWGGRIETVKMDGFTAEYGPMRFERKLQLRFAHLIRELGIKTLPFPGPAPDPDRYPQYDLSPAEAELDTLELLRRGLLLIMRRPLADDDPAGKAPMHQRWIDRLNEKHYDLIRRTWELNGIPLWKLGFWNALSADGVLSHQATMKIRDTGTFYHMIPENLNAVEWTLWWLRALKSAGRQLEKLEGGSEVLVTRILERLRSMHPRVQLHDGCEVIGFRTPPERADAVRVTFRVGKNRLESGLAGHLVLALPQWPLRQLSASLPPDVRPLLDTVEGFPMTKVFFVTEKPWWLHDQKPHTRASRMPTREVHYFRRERRSDPDRHGMVMIYTDRPATEYWNVYVDNRAARLVLAEEVHLAQGASSGSTRR
jgi:monoamine oxidase